MAERCREHELPDIRARLEPSKVVESLRNRSLVKQMTPNSQRPSLVGWRPSQVGWKLEAIASRSEAIATRLEAIALGLEAITLWLEAIAIRLEAVAIRFEALASRLEAIAIRSDFVEHMTTSKMLKCASVCLGTESAQAVLLLSWPQPEGWDPSWDCYCCQLCQAAWCIVRFESALLVNQLN